MSSQVHSLTSEVRRGTNAPKSGSLVGQVGTNRSQNGSNGCNYVTRVSQVSRQGVARMSPGSRQGVARVLPGCRRGVAPLHPCDLQTVLVLYMGGSMQLEVCQ